MYNIHIQFKNNIKKFLKDELTGNDLRRFCFHYLNCNNCRDLLLEEFIFYTTYYDLDKTFKYDYKKELDLKMQDIDKSINSNDKNLYMKYTAVSILMNIFIILLLIIIIRMVYLR